MCAIRWRSSWTCIDIADIFVYRLAALCGVRRAEIQTQTKSLSGGSARSRARLSPIGDRRTLSFAARSRGDALGSARAPGRRPLA